MEQDEFINENMPPEWSNVEMAFDKKERKGGKGKNGHVVNTREYAIAWGIKNRPYSQRQLTEMCKADDAPSLKFLIKTCWKGFIRYYNALVEAGMEPRPPRSESERRRIMTETLRNGMQGLLKEDYNIAQIAAKYGVCTQQEYKNIRQSSEEARQLLPCIPTVIKHYGSWSRFTYEVKKYNMDMVITEYVRKSAECGHWLRLNECDRLKIPIRGIMDVLRSRVFNVLCYRKLAALGLVSEVEEYSGDANAGKTGRSGRKDEE